MSDDIITMPQGADDGSEFHDWTTERIKHELAHTLGLTANSLRRAALLVRTLEERGEDLSGLRLALLSHLKKIACGQLLPEVVVRFAGKPLLITLIGNLPIDDQRRLSSGDPVRLIVIGDDGRRTHRLADPLYMVPRQLRQVFATDHLRTDAEQNLILDDRRRISSAPVPESVGGAKMDAEAGGVWVGRKFFSLSDLETMVRELKRRQRGERGTPGAA
jgi:hypothetical protein